MHAQMHTIIYSTDINCTFFSLIPLPPPCPCCAHPQARLKEVYDNSSDEAGLQLHLLLSYPHKLVKLAGAPARAWLVLQSPPESHVLHVTLVWQNKTATRLPEALWLRFKPGAGAVDESSWLMHKLDSAVSPSEVGVF